MPTYGYRCPACGHQFEKVRKITAKSRPRCPNCGKVAERVITGGAGVHFKGTGFYATDYKKGGPGKREESPPEPKDAKSDKPAPKKTGDEH